MDTAKDARILVLEDALRRLNEVVSNRKLKFHIDYGTLSKAVQSVGSLIYEVKYSYLDAKQLADNAAVNKIVEEITLFSEAYRSAVSGVSFKPQSSKETLVMAEVDYCLRIVDGFRRRLLDHDEDPGFAVDMIAVEVSQVQPLEGSKNLRLCRCTDGTRIWQIVTNLEGIRSSSRLACAILPPVEMMGVVSEAMFLGGDSLPESTELGTLKDPPSKALDQSRAQVAQITKRMT
ncbi:MAG: hypothetical protein JSW61_02250 [Candidatus Thorarchaeota archaeon]|nr:MAG: hypothetical protein JSW61_02250 [Candidatus Thorarchaeota archaeon]